MYNSILKGHFTNPQNVGEIQPSDYHLDVSNPVCGDQIHIYLTVEIGKISDVKYKAYGCAGAIATGSILTETLRGQCIRDVVSKPNDYWMDLLGELEPQQVHCQHILLDLIQQLKDAQ